VRPAVTEGLAKQKKIADAFFPQKLLPRKTDALDISLF
jgi:succinylarginine dihydrolase